MCFLCVVAVVGWRWQPNGNKEVILDRSSSSKFEGYPDAT